MLPKTNKQTFIKVPFCAHIPPLHPYLKFIIIILFYFCNKGCKYSTSTFWESNNGFYRFDTFDELEKYFH